MDLEDEFMIHTEKYLIREYEQSDLTDLMDFLQKCLPESGRNFEPSGAHAIIRHIDINYIYFVCLIERESGQIIGTSALKMIDERKCELKCVYLYKKYHGLGLGKCMCQIVIDRAKMKGFKEMYLDTISETSGRAIKLYKKLGFILTDKYHETVRSDVFMRLNLE